MDVFVLLFVFKGNYSDFVFVFVLSLHYLFVGKIYAFKSFGLEKDTIL